MDVTNVSLEKFRATGGKIIMTYGWADSVLQPLMGVRYVRIETTALASDLWPAWRDGALTPRPFTLRVFAAATADGWTIMPGGFCRVSDRADARAISMGGGARSADVWVLADKPVEFVEKIAVDCHADTAQATHA